MGNYGNRQIRLSNAILNQQIVIQIVGTSKYLKIKQDKVQKKLNAEVNEQKFEITGAYSNQTTYEWDQNQFLQILHSRSSKLLVFKKGIIFLSAFLVFEGYRFPIFINRNVDQNYIHGKVFYLEGKFLREGTLQKDKNFKMLRGNSGSSKQMNYPPQFECQQCSQQVKCKGGCVLGP